MSENFEIYKKLLMEKSGLVITPDKSYLLDSRLTPVAKHWGFENLDAMTAALKGSPDAKMVTDIVEAMTTNETSFFRDSRPFDTFKEHVLPYFKQNNASKKLRIWCAAASSGQEPYSIAMILKEKAAEMPGWTYNIKGTDISHEILDQARQGLYSQFEVQRGLPIQMLMQYFTQDGDKWKINDDIKAMIKYDYFNLLDSMHSLGKFDVVFCRNVLIYFDENTKRQVLEKIAAQMEKDAFLFLGGAETVIGITDTFKPIPDRRGLYGLTDGPHFAEKPSTGSQALAS